MARSSFLNRLPNILRITVPKERGAKAGTSPTRGFDICTARPTLRRAVAMTMLSITIIATTAAELRSSEISTDGIQLYQDQIKPLIQRKCSACHGRLKQEASLRLDTGKLMIAGGDSGKALEPGSIESSLIWERVNADDDDRMPPVDEGSALTAQELQHLRTWIQSGAMAPEEATPPSPNEHWAFQPPVRPSLDSEGPRNPIDQVLNRLHDARGIKAQPRATNSLALRRLYLDATGLPPSLDQLNDRRPWPQIVDELLARPEHAERWARHWMDVWRYSDWYGLGAQLRNSQKHLWHWRDWIVESLHADKGYDQMILEMLAADELAPDDLDAIRGTGFLARNYYLFNRTTWLDSTIEHTSKAFLGLTVNCAKCHDHKYDPISQADYYQLRAVFEPHQVRLDPLPGEADLDRDGIPRVFDDHLEIATYLHERGDPTKQDTSAVMEPAVPAFLSDFATTSQAISLPLAAYAPAMRDTIITARLASALRESKVAEQRFGELSKSLDSDAPREDAARLKLQEQLALARVERDVAHAKATSLDATYSAERSQHAGNADADEKAHRALTWQTKLRVAEAERTRLKAKDDKQRESATKNLEKLLQQLREIEEDPSRIDFQPLRFSRKALETPAHKFDDYATVYPKTSTGRRTMLARWIVHPRNPLTARVAVNHIWLRYFGVPLVESVDDFGLRAPKPKHQELLDLLAVELMQSGWSFRHVHRLILTSEAYQRSTSQAGASDQSLSTDPSNELLWRMHPKRMQSQVIRDSILQLANQLDLARGGPSVKPNEPSRRRSLYFLHSRDHQNLFLSKFDDADHLQCYRRAETVVPQQALAMANSRLTRENAANIVRELESQLHTDEGDVEFAMLAMNLLLARPSTPRERSLIAQFRARWFQLEGNESVTESTSNSDEARTRYRTWFVQALLNHNDFLTIR